MPHYVVHYTGPTEFEIEADNEIEAEMEAYQQMTDSFATEEIEDDD